MSFKPQLFAGEGIQLPLANEDELFILERAKISFQVKTIEHTFKGKGRIYCTTQRIIFVAEKGNLQHELYFEAFEIPLRNMMEEKFNQPIFGACSISGIVIPNDGETSVDARFAWKIIFDNGGTGVVLPVFLKLLEKRKKQEKIDINFVHSQRKAYVDPNDPTVIYVAQPVRPVRPATTKEAL